MDEQGEGGDRHTVTHTEGSGSQGNTEFNTLPREVSPLPNSLPRGRKRNPERTSENFVYVCVCGGGCFPTPLTQQISGSALLFTSDSKAH